MSQTAILKDAAASNEQPRPSWWKWVVALTASLGAVMEVIDTSIVNVALTDMQGNLGATLSEIGWVITGYTVANVVIIPLSAWLGDYFGKKNYFIFCLIGFTIASVLCGLSSSLPMLIAARVLQGLAGGGLLAKAQSILFETFPREEQRTAQAVFGLGVMIGPALGPTLGGFLTDTVGWRWIFFINIPFGILATVMASIFFLPDKHNHEMNRRVDWLGIGLMTVGLASLQIMLEEGQKEDWFASHYIVTAAALSVVSLLLFIWREFSIDHPAVDLRVLRYRSLAAGSLYSILLGIGLYGALFAIPIFTQTLLHFTASQTGLLLMPGAIFSGVFMILSGQLTRVLDPRIVIGIGAVILSLTMFHLAGINPQTSEESLFWPLIFRGIGTVMMFLPLTLATLGSIPIKDIPAATGFFNLTRQIGGSVGIAILTTLLVQRENFHRAILSEHISLYDPLVRQRLGAMAPIFQHHGSDPVTAKVQSLALVDNMLNQQASILSFGDLFWLVGITFLLSLGLLFFLGKGDPGKMPTDAH